MYMYVCQTPDLKQELQHFAFLCLFVASIVMKMFPQVSLEGEQPGALRTLVYLDVVMHVHVVSIAFFGCEPFLNPTDSTSVWVVLQVDAVGVHLESTGWGKCRVAECTHHSLGLVKQRQTGGQKILILMGMPCCWKCRNRWEGSCVSVEASYRLRSVHGCWWPAHVAHGGVDSSSFWQCWVGPRRSWKYNHLLSLWTLPTVF